MLSAPRTDPSVPNSGTRLPPWVFDGEAVSRPGVQDTRLWEPVVRDLLNPVPLSFILLTASPKRTPPEIDHVVTERTQGPSVGRYSVIIKETVHDLHKPLPLQGNRPMHSSSHLFLNVPEFCLHSIAARFAHQQELAAAGLAADESEAQEVEGLRFTKPAPGTFRRRTATKRDQAGFLRMKRQRKLL